jgi:hypothetical protein
LDAEEMAVKDFWSSLKVAWTDAAGFDGSWSLISPIEAIAKARWSPRDLANNSPPSSLALFMCTMSFASSRYSSDRVEI